MAGTPLPELAVVSKGSWMATRSRIIAVVAVLMPLAQVGCMGGSWFGSTTVPTVRTLPVPNNSTPTTRNTKFADVLRIPGQQVPLNGAWTPETVVEPPPAVVEPPIPKPSLTANQTPPDPPLVSALREILAGRSGSEYLRQLDPACYESMSQLLPAVVKLSQVPAAQLDPRDASDLMRQFDPTLAIVARRAPLRVEKAVFCRDVRGFGKYDPLPDRVAFHTGQPYFLYVEVGNVPNEPDARAGAEGYATRLSCSVQVRDDTGRTVELIDDVKRTPQIQLQKDKVDFSRSPVRDYYAVFWFYAPSKPGMYSVKFEVRDPATSRSVSRSLPFEVR